MEGFNNLTGSQIDTLCSKIAKGGKQDSCYDQLDGTRNSGYDETITLNYWKAVSKGYAGTIKEFAKKQEKISSGIDTLTTGAGFLSGLFSSSSNQGSDYKTDVVEDKKGLSTGAKVGIGAGVAVLISTLLYFAFRKK
jgi:hypothetical protein